MHISVFLLLTIIKTKIGSNLVLSIGQDATTDSQYFEHSA